jgi:hypothetical protein
MLMAEAIAVAAKRNDVKTFCFRRLRRCLVILTFDELLCKRY